VLGAITILAAPDMYPVAAIAELMYDQALSIDQHPL
jgi:hypothetical protein